MTSGHRVVYISYDGMTDQLGQSQVLPYLRGLTEMGHSYELISFEKAPAALPFRKTISPGIRWTGLRYHKTPTVPATAFDIAQGALTSALAAGIARADLVHVRSYVAATIALPLCQATRTPLIFDMRGLWVDERVEDGSWDPEGKVFKGAKKMEAVLLERSTAITVLTNTMAQYLRQTPPEQAQIRAPIHVIPTCADLEHFSLDATPDAELLPLVKGHRTLIYLGALGGRYRMQEMARFYLAWRKLPGSARLLVISRQDPEPLLAVLREAGAEGELVHRALPPERVPGAIRCAQAGIFLYRGALATKGVSPTKLGELLACGVPAVGNGVGDVPAILSGPNGRVLDNFEDDHMLKVAEQMNELRQNPDTAAQCRRTAETWYSLSRGVRAYDGLYRSLAQKNLPPGDLPWPRTD